MVKKIFFVLFILAAVGSVSSAVNPQVTLHITGAVDGNIVLELDVNKAPITTANFINYVQSGFYNGLIFHRVVNNFMIQGGGYDVNLAPKATGPSIINESFNRLSNVRGTIAMARTPEPNSATSQFFINQADNSSNLDYDPVVYDGSNNAYSYYGYCVFGHVVSGMNIVDAIAVLSTTTKNGMANVPVNNVIIQSATITLNAPVCAQKLQGDINGDCKVNFKDFVAIAQNWLMCNSITVCN
ncbi:MAG: peptidylprolyl isomerase [Sedimentisphaerales bacterium]